MGKSLAVFVDLHAEVPSEGQKPFGIWPNPRLQVRPAETLGPGRPPQGAANRWISSSSEQKLNDGPITKNGWRLRCVLE